MLRLTLGSTPVDISNADIPVVLRSPIFPDDNGKIPGSFVFNFKVPFTNELKQELRYIHRPSKKGKPVIKKPFNLRFGVLNYSGTALVTQVNSSVLELSMPVDTGDFNMVIKELKLKDLDLGSEEQIAPFYGMGVCPEDVNVYEIWEDLNYPTFHEQMVTMQVKLVDLNNNWHETPCSYFTVSASDVPIRMLYRIRLEHIDSHIINELCSLDILVNGGIHENVTLIMDADNVVERIFNLNEGQVISLRLNVRSVSNTTNPDVQHNQIVHFRKVNHELTFEPDGIAPYSSSINKYYPDTNYAVFPYENPSFFDALDDDWFMIDNQSAKELYSSYFPTMNYFKDGIFPIAMKGTVEGINYFAANLFSPCVFIAHIFNKLFEAIDFNCEYNPFVDDIDLKGLLLFNNYSENNYYFKNFLPISPNLNLVDHVPDMSVGDFIRELCRFFGIIFQANVRDRTINFKWLNSIIQDGSSREWRNSNAISDFSMTPSSFNGCVIKQNTGSDGFINDNFNPLDGLNYKGEVFIWNQLPHDETTNVINDCYYVTSRKEYYVWNYDPEFSRLNWILHSNDFFFEYKVDPAEGEEGEPFEIQSEYSPLMINKYPFLDQNICAPGYNGLGANWRGWRIPSTKQSGVFEGIPTNLKNDCSKSLLFYRGLQKDSLGNDYPMATNDVYDYEGNQIADLSLRLDGPHGIYVKKLKPFVEWWLSNSHEYSFKIMLGVDEIAMLDFFRWYKIQGVDYLLKEVRFNIRANSISASEIIAYRR